MERRIPLSTYLAYNDPEGARAIIAGYGLTMDSGSEEEMAAILSALMQNLGAKALHQFAIHHPDKDLIMAANVVAGKEKKSGACGCSGFSGERSSNCSGCGGNCGGAASSADGEGAPEVTYSRGGVNEAGLAAELNKSPEAEKKNSDTGILIVTGILLLITGVVVAKM